MNGRTVGVVEVRLFGELEAVRGDVAVPVRGAKQRALLALHGGDPVSADRLIDVLRGDGQATNPANTLQAQIGQLRRTLGADAIVTSEAGPARIPATRAGRYPPSCAWSPGPRRGSRAAKVTGINWWR